LVYNINISKEGTEMKLKQRRIKTGLKVDTILKYLNISRTTYYFMEVEKKAYC
jgi:DNA-binding XRE family transcriptional regulator